MEYIVIVMMSSGLKAESIVMANDAEVAIQKVKEIHADMGEMYDIAWIISVSPTIA